MTPKTKMIVINTPGNPTGSVYTENELAGLADVALDEDILILSDEIYEKLIYDGVEARQHRDAEQGRLQPHAHGQRLQQALRDDRLAPRLRRRAGRRREGDRLAPEPLHVQPDAPSRRRARSPPTRARRIASRRWWPSTPSAAT